MIPATIVELSVNYNSFLSDWKKPKIHYCTISGIQRNRWFIILRKPPSQLDGFLTLISQPSVYDVHSSVASKVRQIVGHNSFYENLTESEKSPRADFALLTIYIHLMIQVPGGDVKALQIQESQYLMKKCLYVYLQALLPQSTAVLQAGLFIATFEHASGFCEEAYLTIRECARASSPLRLSRTPGCEPHRDNDG
jgi:hypothetical protein